MIATTHAELILRAREEKIETKIVHNAGIMNAVLDTGLQFYKFGRTTTISFWEGNYKPTSFYDVIKRNKKMNLHSLCLLDIDIVKNRHMSPNEAIRRLLFIQKQRGDEAVIDEVVACSRMGSTKQNIIYGKAVELQNLAFGNGLHCLVIPAALHDLEREFLEQFRVKQ